MCIRDRSIITPFNATSIPLFSVSPIFLYCVLYPVPETGKLIRRSLVVLIYNSTLPLIRLLNNPKSNPRLRVWVVSHFKSGLAITVDGDQNVENPLIHAEVPGVNICAI